MKNPLRMQAKYKRKPSHLGDKNMVYLGMRINGIQMYDKRDLGVIKIRKDTAMRIKDIRKALREHIGRRLLYEKQKWNFFIGANRCIHVNCIRYFRTIFRE